MKQPPPCARRGQVGSSVQFHTKLVAAKMNRQSHEIVADNSQLSHIHSNVCCESLSLCTEYRPIGASGVVSMYKVHSTDTQGHDRSILRYCQSANDLNFMTITRVAHIIEPCPGSLTTTASASFSLVILGSLFR